MMISSPSSIFSLTLPIRPAFLRFHPSSHSLIVSTYQLEDSQSRSGSLIHFPSLKHASQLVEGPRREINTTGGVFRFTFHHDNTLLAALTTGTLAVVDVEEWKMKEEIPLHSSSMLLDVSSFPSSSSFVVSTNTGGLIVGDLSTGKTTRECPNGHCLQWTGDPCEVWTCEIIDNDTMASGGEDAMMKIWDVREQMDKPTMQIKSFDAGVTFIRSLWNGNELLTGSYDQSIRIFDRRSPRQPINQVETAGGVWHMEETMTGGWMAACMYGGWTLLDENLTPIAKDETAGETLLYGAGLSPDGNTLAYCTFNDKTVRTVDVGKEAKGWEPFSV